MNEGIVEGGKDAGNAEDELALFYRQFVPTRGESRRRTSRTWGPSCGLLARVHSATANLLTWMFSCAPRSTFFLGGMLAVYLLRDWRVRAASFGDVELLVGGFRLCAAKHGADA